MKSLKHIIPASKVNMGGIILDQPLPNQIINSIDPFLLIHHWESTLSGGKAQKVEGVGPHPHRGFSPVSFIYKGGIHHRDSRGNDSIIYEGGTQWMNAGHGITHSERPAKELAENGGDFEFIQFWVNTPAKYKMEQPKYIPLTNEETPLYVSNDKKVNVQIVAGEFMGIKGAIETFSPIKALRFDMQANSSISFDIPKSYNTLLYQLHGEIAVNASEAREGKYLFAFNNDGKNIKVEAIENTQFMLLAGEPLNEKVVSHGPFVMNSQTEIMEAMRDAQQGKMGVLIEEF